MPDISSDGLVREAMCTPLKAGNTADSIILILYKQHCDLTGYLKGCPIDKLDRVIAYELPQLLTKYLVSNSMKCILTDSLNVTLLNFSLNGLC